MKYLLTTLTLLLSFFSFAENSPQVMKCVNETVERFTERNKIERYQIDKLMLSGIYARCNGVMDASEWALAKTGDPVKDAKIAEQCYIWQQANFLDENGYDAKVTTQMKAAWQKECRLTK